MHSADSTSQAGFLRLFDTPETRTDMLVAIIRCLAAHNGRPVPVSNIVTYVMGALNCSEEETDVLAFVMFLQKPLLVTDTVDHVGYATVANMVPALSDHIRFGHTYEDETPEDDQVPVDGEFPY